MNPPVYTKLGSMLLAVAALHFTGCNAAPEPKYDQVLSDGEFSVRKYDTLKLVSAPMNAGMAQRNQAFRPLFNYIGGNNQAKQKIAMTTPVIMSGGMQERQAEANKNAEMSFVLGDDALAKGDAPKPSDEKLQLGKIDAGYVAVYRFKGSAVENNRLQAQKKLEEWLQKRGYKAKAPAMLAVFDPPWIPKPFERNEIWIPLKEHKDFKQPAAEAKTP